MESLDAREDSCEKRIKVESSIYSCRTKIPSIGLVDTLDLAGGWDTEKRQEKIERDVPGVRERERECVCVCEREREREWQRGTTSHIGRRVREEVRGIHFARVIRSSCFFAFLER